MNENGSGARMKSKNQKEEFDDEKVREIIEMEFDSLEEWKDVELTKLREDYKNKINNLINELSNLNIKCILGKHIFSKDSI